MGYELFSFIGGDVGIVDSNVNGDVSSDQFGNVVVFFGGSDGSDSGGSGGDVGSDDFDFVIYIGWDK